MLKLISLKAEGWASSNSNDGEQQKESGGLSSWINKMDKMWNEESNGPAKKSSEYDMLAVEARQEKLDAFYKDRSESTWRERLNIMWSYDEYGMPGPELEFVKLTTEISFVFGFSLGAFLESAKVQRIFHEQNKYTMFQHPREAQRALQERMVLAMIQGGWRVCWRMALLNFMFVGVSQSLVVIRNYVNPIDFAAGGAAMGAMYKANMGPKGMVGGGFVGAILGLQGGVLIWGLQKFTGETVAERWAREYNLVQQAKEDKKEIKAKKDIRIIIKEEEEFQASQTEDVIEESDWVRNFSIKLHKFLEDAGLVQSAGSDSFRISDENHRLNTVKVSKVDLEDTSDITRTQPQELSENDK